MDAAPAAQQLLVLFVFRLGSRPAQGYAATATELWDQCRSILPQSQPVSPGALSRARAKIHPQAFLRTAPFTRRATTRARCGAASRLRRRRLQAEPAPPAAPRATGERLSPRLAQLRAPSCRSISTSSPTTTSGGGRRRSPSDRGLLPPATRTARGACRPSSAANGFRPSSAPRSARTSVVAPSATATARHPAAALACASCTAGATSFALATTLLGGPTRRAPSPTCITVAHRGTANADRGVLAASAGSRSCSLISRCDEPITPRAASAPMQAAHASQLSELRTMARKRYCSTRPRCARPSGACSPASRTAASASVPAAAEIAQARQQVEVLQQARRTKQATRSLTP